MSKIVEDKILFFSKKIIDNSEKILPFQDHNFYLFSELRILLYEITHCIMFDLNQASFCLTNHLLERVLKLSLIKYELEGLNISDPIFKEKQISAYKKYDDMLLWKTLSSAYENNIIINEEYNMLLKFKDKYRNPFSHANVSKLIPEQQINNSMIGHIFNLEESFKCLTDSKPIPIQEVLIDPLTLVQEYQYAISNREALDYFNNVFEIMINIDERYKVKYKIVMP